VKKRTLAQEEALFADISALIEEEKAASLAAFDQQAFHARVLSRLGDRRRPGWARSPRLLAACGFALLIVTWAVLAPTPKATRRSIDVRVVERALLHAAASRAAGRVATPVEPALSDDVWVIERALLTWRRQQGGTVDVERALCFAAGRSGSSRSCPSYEVRDVAAPGAKQRLERALIELERDGTIHRALVGRQRT
jgi:hypothetical protein